MAGFLGEVDVATFVDPKKVGHQITRNDPHDRAIGGPKNAHLFLWDKQRSRPEDRLETSWRISMEGCLEHMAPCCFAARGNQRSNLTVRLIEDNQPVESERACSRGPCTRRRRPFLDAARAIDGDETDAAPVAGHNQGCAADNDRCATTAI